MFLMLPNNSDFLVVIILPCPEIKNYWVMSVLCFSHFIKLCVNSVSLFLLVDILFNFISNNLCWPVRNNTEMPNMIEVV